ncbi:MAG: hypothetical protein QM534_02380 [Sediminibacterium sp.]|nr:hypothetical protein [Sediminibacterium sp.]
MDKLLKGIETLIEWFSMLKIIASPLLAGGLLGLFTFLYNPGLPGIIAFAVCALAGLLIGIWLVTRIKRKQNAVEFNARIHASPDINEAIKTSKDHPPST